MRSDDYLEGVLYIPDDRHMFTVIPMNLFEQAVIYIYNGKSVKKVYNDRGGYRFACFFTTFFA